jgi:uncharacterized circularly permuted ATP-grasp superfamily protein/uncharacterized alpha-E superfamily protein
MLESSQSLPPNESRTTDLVAYDELRDLDGNIRPAWRRFIQNLDALGTLEAKTRWTKAKQLIQENGASYNVYSDARELERPWRLSPIPLVIGPGDWQVLSRGIAQRARLLSGILSDLYGPQRSLMDGDLPCELVFDNPHFLRPLHGLAATKNNWLPLYGVDLIRAPDGRHFVLNDCTQSPEGMGYALENRIIMSQILPDLLRDCNVERLVSFFRLLGERLVACAPHNRDDPRIALLTPGPYSATYFEQAYLAKYLALTLVQGEDLAVRDDRVFLKTLGGLQPVDVILRRVFDDYCDPLELRPDSELGVPGLVQAIRAGNVNCLNPLGTGLLETPALLAFLPGLCRKLLNEELLIASVPTYYCGRESSLKVVVEEFDDMVVKPTFAAGRTNSTFVRCLAARERSELLDRILAAPTQFVAQRFIPSSKTPVIADGEMRSRACVLRCFASCSHPSDYYVMPGGVARVASTDNDPAVSLHHGARSKDVWVVSDEPVPEPPLATASNQRVELSRGGGDLPSRVADNLYWLGRYAERAEGVGRLARVIGVRLLEITSNQDLANSTDFGYLLTALHCQTQFLLATPPPGSTGHNELQSERELYNAIVDDQCGGSIASTIVSALRVGKVVRDRISHDTWRVLASLEESVKRMRSVKGRDGISQLVNEINHIIITLAGFSGLVMESMTRGFAWRFLDMGRRIERAITLVTLMRTTLVYPSDREVPLLEAVLDIADSGMTYRRRYPANLQVAPAVDLLLSDESNPRGVSFQLRTLAQHIDALPPLPGHGVRSKQQRLVLSATSRLELVDIDEACKLTAKAGMRSGLYELLHELSIALPALSDSLSETYLYHASVARHLRQEESSRGALLTKDGPL